MKTTLLTMTLILTGFTAQAAQFSMNAKSTQGYSVSQTELGEPAKFVKTAMVENCRVHLSTDSGLPVAIGVAANITGQDLPEIHAISLNSKSLPLVDGLIKSSSAKSVVTYKDGVLTETVDLGKYGKSVVRIVTNPMLTQVTNAHVSNELKDSSGNTRYSNFYCQY